MPLTNDRGETFGRWLLAKRDGGDWVDQLAEAARKDPAFPRMAGLMTRARLRQMNAEGDMFEAVEDAEGDWLSA